MTIQNPTYAPLAEHIGANALPLYFAALAVLLLTVAGLWALARRYPLPRADSTLPPNGCVLVWLGFGCAAAVGGAGVFVALAKALAEPSGTPGLGALDELLLAAVGHHLPAGAQTFFAVFTHLGDTATLSGLVAVVAAALLAQQRRQLALSWTVAVAGNALLNTALKGFFERSRPVHDAALQSVYGWSFPSGHSSAAVVAYGMLAYVLMRTWPPAQRNPAGCLLVVLAASAVAFTIGCSRVFIGAHYASDVLAGFASGSAWLAVCIGSIELRRHDRRSAHTGNRS